MELNVNFNELEEQVKTYVSSTDGMEKIKLGQEALTDSIEELEIEESVDSKMLDEVIIY